MKDHRNDHSFPRDLYKNSKMPKPYDYNQLSYKNDFPIVTRSKIDLISSPRIQQKLKVQDLIFGASSARESLGGGLGRENKRKINSHKILPPLKPALHVSSYTPRKNPQMELNSRFLTITFSCEQVMKHKVMK